MTVCGVWSSHLKLPFSQQTSEHVLQPNTVGCRDKGTLPTIEELDISEEPDVERHTSGRKYVTLDVSTALESKEKNITCSIQEGMERLLRGSDTEAGSKEMKRRGPQAEEIVCT